MELFVAVTIVVARRFPLSRFRLHRTPTGEVSLYAGRRRLSTYAWLAGGTVVFERPDQSDWLLLEHTYGFDKGTAIRIELSSVPIVHVRFRLELGRLFPSQAVVCESIDAKALSAMRPIKADQPRRFRVKSPYRESPEV